MDRLLFWLLVPPLLNGSVYNIVLKEEYHPLEDFLLDFSSCKILQNYRNLAQLNYFAFSLSCETKPTLSPSQINLIKYFELSIGLEVAQLEKLHLIPEQPRSDIPDLSQHNDCTITYDVYKSFRSQLFLHPPPAQTVVSDDKID
jgi:hypothetical protein